MSSTRFNWSATDFFEALTAHCKFALARHFRFCRVSGIEGFEEVLASMQQTTAFVAVSDISQGYIDINKKCSRKAALSIIAPLS